ncbi:MAG TPA: hypothetical protein VK137_20595 [Planctomycetaceae bacterium]|nr:hypothetical protein [Planctomycetaceae bacterium]
MPLLRNGDRLESLSPSHGSPAGWRLRRSDTESREQSREERFRAWQARWADVKAQLIHRLDVIDEQLARLALDDRVSPRLSIVGDEFDEQ